MVLNSGPKPITCGKVCNWILQVLLLVSLFSYLGLSMKSPRQISSQYDKSTNTSVPIYEDPSSDAFVAFIIIYIIYFINSMCSETFSYLRHFHTNSNGSNIYNHMQKLFYSHPTLTMVMESYHYQTVIRERQDSDGYFSTTVNQEKYVTHVAREDFRYLSWRDVSGPFTLETEGFVGNPLKALVKLHTFFVVEFADDTTANDYEYQKNNFILNNQYRDNEFSFNEEHTLSGLSEFTLVAVGDSLPWFTGPFWYLVSAFVCVVELYKIYVDRFCIEQEYTIKKLISSRNNLNDESVAAMYLARNPSIVVLNTEQKFNDCARLGDPSILNNLPSLEEVNAITPHPNTPNNNAATTTNINVASSNISYNTFGGDQPNIYIQSGVNSGFNFNNQSNQGHQMRSEQQMSKGNQGGYRYE